MKNSKRIFLMMILLTLVSINVKAQPRRQSNRTADRQASVLLRRLERHSNAFRGNLNSALVSRHVDQMQPQNDINSFAPALVSAINLFRERLNQHLAEAVDVQDILEKASLVNGFMARNRISTQVQNDWESVRTDLNALANFYRISWQWNRPVLSAVNSSRLTDDELNRLIQRIEVAGYSFRVSLTDAFNGTTRAEATGEGDMNDAVLNFKKATDHLVNQYDARDPIADSVQRLITRAAPLETYMRNHGLTSQAQNAWSDLRRDLNRLALAYDIRII